MRSSLLIPTALYYVSRTTTFLLRTSPVTSHTAAATSRRGKNFARTFTHPKCSIKSHYPRSFDKVLALQEKHDPKGVFEPELWQHIREEKPFELYPR
jgi:hypothetical protein